MLTFRTQVRNASQTPKIKFSYHKSIDKTKSNKCKNIEPMSVNNIKNLNRRYNNIQ